MEQMTFLDFFAGIGGFRKGFELCGMRCVGHCEIDKYADRSYRAIHDVKEDEWYAADITKVAPADLPRADLWAGGFPCQDISVAGRQRGLDGARSGLFFTLAQLVKGQSPENRPTWIVLENVKNLLSIHGGWDFATVLDTLASLGYHIEYGLLNTKYFGPPQNRERVFIVACRHPGAGRGPKIFPVPAGSGKALIQLIGGMQGQRVYDPAGISVTMAAQSGGWGGKTGLYFVDLCNGNPTSPFSVLSQWLIGDEVNVVEDFQKQYGYNQQLGIYEKDYIDGSGQSYEGIIFTDGVTEVVYYNQLDERWADLPYGTDNIGGYGCGPTSMAIVVSSLTDQTVDPPTMAEWAYQNGYWCSGNGSYHSLIPGAAEGFGLQWESISTDDPQAVVDTLASGKLIVALMSKGHFTSSGHFMVLRGVTSEGKILVADPASKKRSEQEWDISIILDEARKGAAAGGPLWAIY